MKKFFKEINLLKLMGVVLGIIECSLMTTFLILCREWINYSGSLFVYFVVCIFDIVISGGLIYIIGLLIWELIENKKEKKKRKNISNYFILKNLNS